MSNSSSSTGAYAECGCWTGAWWGVTPPPRCVEHGGIPSTIIPNTVTTTTLRVGGFIDSPPQIVKRDISDADVDRIARRVVELLRKEQP